MSHALRHNPTRYGVSLDDSGWVCLDGVLNGLKGADARFESLTAQDIRELVQNSGIARFELVGERIRARYGHSVNVNVADEPTSPPEYLFHGTSTKHLLRIQSKGLQPIRRQFVHLSSDFSYSQSVAKSFGFSGIVLRIRAGKAAHDYGLRFWRASDVVWLSGPIPPKFVQWIAGRYQSGELVVAELVRATRPDIDLVSMRDAIASMFFVVSRKSNTSLHHSSYGNDLSRQ